MHSIEQNPAMAWYVEKYGNDPFMMKLLVVSAEITAKIGDDRKSEK